MLAVTRTERDKIFYESTCASPDRQIDNLVYELYDLTPEEIAIVEGSQVSGWRRAGQVGMGMVPRGEVGIVVAQIGLGLTVINQSLYGVVLVMQDHSPLSRTICPAYRGAFA